MVQLISKAKNLALLSFVVLALYGCGGGGGGSSASVGSLFSSGLASSGSNVDPDPGNRNGDIPTTHNPEPATMLLLGGGAMAMTYLRKRKN